MYKEKVVFGFSQALNQNQMTVKCLMLSPEGQSLLETDCPTGSIPKFLKFPGMREGSTKSEPGDVWYLTLLAAAILEKDSLDLEEEHKETIEEFYEKKIGEAGPEGDKS